MIHDEREGAAMPEALAGVDLNLLVAFDALTREVNVTRAARRVGLTQSAMSHALRRLRDLLGDPLLVRGRGGMVLTPRAEALVVPLRGGLVTLHRALSERPGFDPATTRRAFRLTSPDLFDVVILPRLLETVRRSAPGIDLAVVSVADSRLTELLETGEIDLAVVPRLDVSDDRSAHAAPGMVRRTLFRDHLVCLLRAGHPALESARGRRRKPATASISLDTYVRLSHAMISPAGAGGGPVDEALAQLGLQRRIALRVPGFYAALAIVAQSDLVLTGPSGLLLVAPSDPPIVSVPPPLNMPGHAIDLVWHERFSNDPGHAWLRESIADITDETLANRPAGRRNAKRRRG